MGSYRVALGSRAASVGARDCGTKSVVLPLGSEIAREAWSLVEEGAVRPVMDEIFPLAEAAAAHTRMEAGDHIGKIVLAVDEEL